MEQRSPTNLIHNIQDTNDVSQQDSQHDFNDPSPASDIFLDQDDDNSGDDLPEVTKKIKKISFLKKKYNNISNDLRSQLLDAVENRNEKIKHAAKRLGVNYSSAKSICQVFKREGRSEKKTFKRRGFREEPDTQRTYQTEDFNHSQGQIPQQIPVYPHQNGNSDFHPPEPTAPDTLTALRDRLLSSRGGMDKDKEKYNGDVPMKQFQDFGGKVGDGIPQGSSDSYYMDTNKNGNGMLGDGQGAFSHTTNNIYLMQNQPMQQKMNESGNPSKYQMPPAQQIYFIPQMGQMIISQPNNMNGGGNFNNNGFSQNNNNMQVHPRNNGMNAGPFQTININQPQGKNLSIQNISFNGDMQNQKTFGNNTNGTTDMQQGQKLMTNGQGLANMQGFQIPNMGNIQGNLPTMQSLQAIQQQSQQNPQMQQQQQQQPQPQQLQFLQVQQQPGMNGMNMMMNPYFQMVQPVMYLTPQGQLIQVNNQPQYIQANVPYMMGNNNNNSNNQMTFQPVFVNAAFNGQPLQSGENDVKQKMFGMQSMENTNLSAFQQKR